MTLYHISNWEALKTAVVGETYVLRPGTQNAEGVGVYFSEGEPRWTAAEGSVQKGVSAVIAIDTPLDATAWWLSKGGKARKFNKPRTWHSAGKNLAITIVSIDTINNLPLLHCVWQGV